MISMEPPKENHSIWLINTVGRKVIIVFPWLMMSSLLCVQDIISKAWHFPGQHFFFICLF